MAVTYLEFEKDIKELEKISDFFIGHNIFNN